jgi:hypothetical protein
MALHLKAAAIQTALAKTAGELKPGEIDDLIDACNRINCKQGPDHNRAGEPALGTLFPVGMNP